MMVIFFLSGVSILILSGRELLRKLASYRRFEHAEGIIVGIRRKTMSAMSSGRSRTTVMHFPIISFSKRAGETTTFTSETGDSGPVSRYARGQRIIILYDPEGEFVPMIATWSGVWLANLMGVLGGIVFLVGAFLIYWAFWDRIVGG